MEKLEDITKSVSDPTLKQLGLRGRPAKTALTRRLTSMLVEVTEECIGTGGAALATCYRGSASAENQTAIAVGWGILAKAKGVKGAHIVLADWRETKDGWDLHGAKMVRIDGKKYKPDTWYTIKNGKVVAE